MALNWTPVAGNFNDILYNALLKLEAPVAFERLNGTLVNGNFTIGIGFDLLAGGEPVRAAVFDQIGLRGVFANSGGAVPASGTLARKEYDFVQELVSTIKAHKGSSDLNAIMARRAAAAQADPAYRSYLGAAPRGTFSFANEAEVRQAFDVLWKDVYQPGILNRWPELKTDMAFRASKEQITLASIVWNGGPGLLGSNLRAAVRTGNRAEAWFEIRYGSNGGKSQNDGLAKRRYVESELLGLYDNAANVLSDEARRIFGMLTKHRAEIFAYEAKYGVPPDGTNATRNVIALANSDSNLASIAQVQSLFNALIPARDAFISWANTELPPERQIDVSILNPAAIYFASDTPTAGAITVLDATKDDGKGTGMEQNVLVGGNGTDVLTAGAGDDILLGRDGSDVLEGGSGVDELFGGADNDILEGGKGDDILYGGTGDDLYLWSTGDGTDTIVDPDGGRLLIERNDLKFGGGVMIKDGESNVWKDPSGKVVLTHNSPWRIELPDGSVIQLGEDFDPVEWGIELRDETDPTRTYTGDQRAPIRGIETDLHILPGDPRFNTYDWSATSWSADGTLNAGMAEPDFNDVIDGSADKDRIDGLGGNDALDGLAGDDRIDGGAGDDLIGGGAGSDTIHGGEGDDYIFGATGLSANQRVGPDDQWNPPAGKTLRTRGSTWGVYGHADGTYTVSGGGALSMDSAGDVAYGEAGNDDITGGLGNDYIDGGDDDDVLIGHGGDDIVVGGTGADHLRGDGIKATGYYETLAETGHGSDLLDGGEGDDTLLGGGRDDVLYGGAGADVLWGDDKSETRLAGSFHGADHLDGEDGDDQLVGGGKDDILYGGEGNDQLWGDGDSEDMLGGTHHGSDHLDGEADNDDLFGGGAGDTLLGGAGADILIGDDIEANLAGDFHGADWLDGEDGDDHLTGGGADDTLIGGAGADLLFGDDREDKLAGSFHGADWLDGEDDDDSLVGGGADDILFGGQGDDILVGDDESEDFLAAEFHGNDALDGEEGNDQLTGGGKDDTLLGGSGNDLLWGDDIAQSLPGGQHGSDTLDGQDGDDQLFGGGRDDTLEGGAGNDFLRGDDAVEQLTASWHGNDVLDGGEGHDTLLGDGGNDILQGGAGDDWLAGEDQFSTDAASQLTGNDLLDGGDGADTLMGGNGDDALDGGRGNDLLLGGAGNDTLDGGAGVDWLSGGEGDDTFHVDQLEGAETIADFGRGADRLVLGSPVQGITFHNVDGALVLQGDDGSFLRLSSYFSDPSRSAQAQIELADGTTWSRSQIASLLDLPQQPWPNTHDYLTGTAGDDRLYGSWGNDVLIGAAGNDRAFGFAGSDLLHGGPGNDTLDGENGNDLLQGGAGSDFLMGGAGSDVLEGGEGDDVLDGAATYGATNAYTLSEADILDGGQGNDELRGSNGDDIYVFGHGDGFDRIVEFSPGTGTGNVIRFRSDVSADDVVGVRTEYLTVFWLSATDQLSIHNDSLSTIARVEFADGTVWDQADIAARTAGTAVRRAGPQELSLVVASNGPFELDVAGELFRPGSLSGTLTYSLLDPAPAGLTVDAATGRLSGALDDLQGDRRYLWLAATDELGFTRSIGITARIASDSGALVGTTQDDVIQGTGGNDSFRGLAGADWMMGGTGSDTYAFTVGDGHDIIEESNPLPTLDQDTVSFLGPLTPADVQVRREGADLVLAYGAGDSLAMRRWFETASNRIEEVRFADGTVWNAAHLQALAEPPPPGPVPPAPDPAASTPLIAGTAAPDALIGTDGNDIFIGLAGDDVLSGGAGDDAYRYRSGDGNDFIDDWSGSDVLELMDLNPGDVRIARGGGYTDGRLIDRATGQSIVLGLDLVDSEWSGSGYFVEQVKFADGTLWGTEQLRAAARADETLVGTAGADTLEGFDGNDLLDGGTGADRLDGGHGDDTYRYRLGDGSDTLVDSGGTDSLELLDLNPSDVLVGQSWLGQMEFYIPSTGDVITLETRQDLDPTDQQLERIVFADGTVWGPEELQASRAQTEALAHTMVQDMASFSSPAAGLTFVTSPWQNSSTPTLAVGAQ